MNVILLCRRDEVVCEVPLLSALEVGRGGGCDIVVADAELSERHLVLKVHEGVVWVHRLGLEPGDPSAEPERLPMGRSFRLGQEHSLVCSPEPGCTYTRVSGTDRIMGLYGVTENLTRPKVPDVGLSLLVASEGRIERVHLSATVMTVGSGMAVDIRLEDRAVSGLHCRIESSEESIRIRDLGSKNGTFLDGVQVVLARLSIGSTIRVGRTELRLVARAHEVEKEGGAMIAASDSMRAVLEKIERIAEFRWPTLIRGESGVGKEGLAQALHRSAGAPAEAPFVAVNAGALPRSLVASELFGHEKGAFTGASARHRGVFERADGGTLFLDEIGELPLDLQARLLRVVEDWRVTPVGAEHSIPVDVRLVCATHRDLRQMVARGEFRQDLYFRLTRLVVWVPPLRERAADVSALAEHFLKAERAQLGPRSLSQGALACLLDYPWPGNARELRNVVCAAAANSAAQVLDAVDIQRALSEVGAARMPEPTHGLSRLEEAYQKYNGNYSAAARSLGLARTTFRGRLLAAREALGAL